MITRREFNRRMNAMNTRVLWLENALDSFTDTNEEVERSERRISELELFKKLSSMNHSYHVTRDVERRRDIELLYEHLGLEITTTPEKRAVVKKGK